MKIKKRLDQYILEKYSNYSRNQIQSFIMQGKISVNDKIVTKSGFQVTDQDQINLNIEIPKYVCRAGFKLEKAIDYFKIDLNNLVILDAGLSTGGFTDCLLQYGAKKVYGVDVGYGQVHEKIRTDKRVVVLEKTNLRYLENLPEKVDLVTLDLSFISILKVMDTVNNILKDKGQLITLIKPQFEAEKSQVGKGGIIKDPEIHKLVVDKIISGIVKFGFEFIGVVDSPILGTEGNKEFLAYFIKK